VFHSGAPFSRQAAASRCMENLTGFQHAAATSQ
jgi:hypothetical protein